jgi:tetratricopeptide (TPR) repeat protein
MSHRRLFLAYVALVIFLAGCMTLPVLAQNSQTPDAVCHQEDTGPEKYLVGIEEMPVQTMAPAAIPDYPEGGVSGWWWVEWLLCLALCVAVGWIGVLAYQSRATVPLILCSLAALLFGVLAVDNIWTGRAVGKSVQAAKEAFQVEDHVRAEEHLRAAQERQYTTFLRHLTPGFDSAIERLDLDTCREVNGVAAIHQALAARDSAGIDRAMDFFPTDTERAVEAKVAGLTQASAWHLADGNFRAALAAAERADGFPAWQGITRPNVCAARYHRVVELAEMGDSTGALPLIQGMDSPTCEVEPLHRVVLRGLVARAHSQKNLVLDDLLKAETAAALAFHRDAFETSRQAQTQLPFVDCDYAAALEIHATASLARKEPEAAVEAFDRAEEVIPGRPIVAAGLPRALHSLGMQQVSDERYPEAVAIMERGYALTERKDPVFVEGLSRVHLLHGAHQLDQGETDLGIGSLEAAYQVNSGNREIQDALADALLFRGDERLQHAEPDAARPDFERAAKVSRVRYRTAEMRLRVMGESPQRLRVLNSKPSWYEVPPVVAEVPRDTNNDGEPEKVLYYSADREEPVAVGSYSPGQREPGELLLLNEEGETIVVLSDITGNGTLDERSDYSGGQIFRLLSDVDDDASPDIHIAYEEGMEVSREILSGSILMMVREGLIAGDWIDPFSYPDAYIKLFHRGNHIFTSDTIQDNYHPIWNQGVVLHYRHGDWVRLELWDEDVIWDDHVDSVTIRRFPESGVLRFDANKGAVRLGVAPAELPEGHRVRFREEGVPSNYFLSHPTAAEEYGDLLAAAKADALRADTMDYLADTAAKTAIGASSASPFQKFGMKVAWEVFYNAVK